MPASLPTNGETVYVATPSPFHRCATRNQVDLTGEVDHDEFAGNGKPLTAARATQLNSSTKEQKRKPATWNGRGFSVFRNRNSEELRLP